MKYLGIQLYISGFRWLYMQRKYLNSRLGTFFFNDSQLQLKPPAAIIIFAPVSRIFHSIWFLLHFETTKGIVCVGAKLSSD